MHYCLHQEAKSMQWVWIRPPLCNYVGLVFHNMECIHQITAAELGNVRFDEESDGCQRLMKLDDTFSFDDVWQRFRKLWTNTTGSKIIKIMKQHPSGQCWQVLSRPGLVWGMAKQNLCCRICFGQAPILNIVLSLRSFQVRVWLLFTFIYYISVQKQLSTPTSDSRVDGVKPWEETLTLSLVPRCFYLKCLESSFLKG